MTIESKAPVPGPDPVPPSKRPGGTAAFLPALASGPIVPSERAGGEKVVLSNEERERKSARQRELSRIRSKRYRERNRLKKDEEFYAQHKRKYPNGVPDPPKPPTQDYVSITKKSTIEV